MGSIIAFLILSSGTSFLIWGRKQARQRKHRAGETEKEEAEKEVKTQEVLPLPSPSPFPSPSSPPYEVLGSSNFGQELDSHSNMVNEMDAMAVHEIGEANRPHELDVTSAITRSR